MYDTTRVDSVRKKYTGLTYDIVSLQDQSNARASAIESLKASLETSVKAALVIKTVAHDLQLVLEQSISDLVDKALQGVFGDAEAFNFKMRYVIKSGKVEVEFAYVTPDGNELSPLEDSGIGTVDVTAFAMRLSLWFLSTKSIRPIIILDEPFKNISANYRPLFLELVRKLANETQLQLIIVTHQEDVIDIADNVIKVTKRGLNSPSEVVCRVKRQVA